MVLIEFLAAQSRFRGIKLSGQFLFVWVLWISTMTVVVMRLNHLMRGCQGSEKVVVLVAG